MRKAVVGMLTTLSLFGCSQPPGAAPLSGQARAITVDDLADRRTITVSGDGVVRVAPDTATVTVGVEARATQAAAAQEQVNVKGQAIIAAWKAAGAADKAIQTVGLDLYPEYARPEQTGADTLIGYRATLRMAVRSRPERAGDLADVALQNGANRFEGVAFSREANEQARQEAVEKAIQQAMRQAKAALGTLTLQLDEVRKIEIGGSYIQPPIPLAYGGVAARMEASTPIQPGEMEIRATVTITASF